MHEYTIEIIIQMEYSSCCCMLVSAFLLEVSYDTTAVDQHLLDVSNLRSYYIYHTCITFLSLLNYEFIYIFMLLVCHVV